MGPVLPFLIPKSRTAIFALMEQIKDYERKKPYTVLIPDLDEWPIVKISKMRKEVIREVVEETVSNIVAKHRSEKDIHDELAKAVYLEKMRIDGRSWSIDPKDDAAFWNWVNEELVHVENAQDGKIEQEKEILSRIISRYANEIVGNFKKSTYHLGERLVPFVYSRLLNPTKARIVRAQKKMFERIHLVGEIEQVRTLSQKGTIIMVPTHFSNIDSITIGWVIDAVGLPGFFYGAGLNLFSVKFLAYFMNRLGAYKVDRRKKNSIYLETLKTYSTRVIMKGGHSLFFPGGTRSRSGAIEKNLKLGLLGTALEAQRRNIIDTKGENYQKIFVAPVVFNYSFVLEAPSLIDEHLRNVGRERYFVEHDKFSTSYNMLKFLVKLFTKGADFSISFGQCMDIFGNPVDDEGRSLDNNGNEIDIRDYFKSKGELKYDTQRDSVYTRMLSEAILDSYYKNNVVLTSFLVSFVAFEMFKKKNPSHDEYSVLRMAKEYRKIPYDEFKSAVLRLLPELKKLEKNGKLKLDPILYDDDTDWVISHGIKNVGVYHARRPLLLKKNMIVSDDMKVLLYYHNRMQGYDLDHYV